MPSNRHATVSSGARYTRPLSSKLPIMESSSPSDLDHLSPKPEIEAFSPQTMCIVIDHIHQTCHHHRKRQGIEPCPQRGNHRICPAIVIAHTTYITNPGLCPTCYRVEEEKIFEKYESKIRPLQERLAALKKTPNLPRPIKFYEGRYNEGIKQKKDKRMQKLKEFREAQGVWGDG